MSEIPSQTTKHTLLNVENLSVHFALRQTSIEILHNISFTLTEGKTVCLVGESGCGKSMTALSILRLLPNPGRITSGNIVFNGENLTVLSETKIRKKRGKDIGMIFQEPMTSLNPVIKVGKQISEVLIQHSNMSAANARDKTIELLSLAGIPSPEQRILDYPHQLSGGIRQRIMIAMALACEPKLLLADEPTTALDVTIQGQILTLLQNLSKQKGMGMLLITHNLGVVAEMADDVCVMYAGRIVEKAPVLDLFATPQHPYTQALINAVPLLTNKGNFRLQSIPGMVPTPASLPKGCSFGPRCPLFHEKCLKEPPAVSINKEGTHSVSCWLCDKNPVSQASKI